MWKEFRALLMRYKVRVLGIPNKLSNQSNALELNSHGEILVELR
jgi:hypothetical protein